MPHLLAPLDPSNPKVLRTVPEERKLIADWMERVLAAHPAWPWPLIEEEARRRAEEAPAARRSVGRQGGRESSTPPRRIPPA
jgi:hypothetical protein